MSSGEFSALLFFLPIYIGYVAVVLASFYKLVRMILND